jgi:hypothetical protein
MKYLHVEFTIHTDETKYLLKKEQKETMARFLQLITK